LRHVNAQHVEHDHHERNHQGIGDVIPMPRARARAVGAVQCRQRLGGVLQFYEREAA
jgi:hypothetical protein